MATESGTGPVQSGPQDELSQDELGFINTVDEYLKRIRELESKTAAAVVHPSSAQDLRRFMRATRGLLSKYLDGTVRYVVDVGKAQVQAATSRWNEAVADAAVAYRAANHELKRKKIRGGPEPPFPGCDESPTELEGIEGDEQQQQGQSGIQEEDLDDYPINLDGFASSGSRHENERPPGAKGPAQQGEDQFQDAHDDFNGGEQPPGRSATVGATDVRQTSNTGTSATTNQPPGTRAQPRFSIIAGAVNVRRTSNIHTSATTNQGVTQGTVPPANLPPLQQSATSALQPNSNPPPTRKASPTISAGRRERRRAREEALNAERQSSNSAHDSDQEYAGPQHRTNHVQQPSLAELIEAAQMHLSILDEALHELATPAGVVGHESTAEVARTFGEELAGVSRLAPTLAGKIQIEHLSRRLIEKAVHLLAVQQSMRLSQARQNSTVPEPTMPRPPAMQTNFSHLSGSLDPFRSAVPQLPQPPQQMAQPALGNNTMESLLQLQLAKDTGKYLQPFKGGSQDYLYWRAGIEPIKNSLMIDEPTKFCRIRATLAGEAYRRVSHVLPYECNALDRLLTILHEEYGSPEDVIEEQYARLHRLKTPKEQDLKTLREFLCELQSIIAVMENCGRQPKSSPDFFAAVQKKVPKSYGLRWVRKRRLYGQTAMESLLCFLEEEARSLKIAEHFAVTNASCNSSLATRPKEFSKVGLDQPTTAVTTKPEKAQPSHQDSRKTEDKKPESKEKDSERTSQICPECKGPHLLEKCRVFKAMAPNQRFKKVSSVYRVHYRCLQRHKKDACPVSKDQQKCPVDQACPHFHHPLLHGTTFKSRPKADANVVIEEEILSNVSWEQSCHLNLIPIKVRGPSGKVLETTALFDEGCSRTLIDRSLVEQLEIPAKYTTVDLFGINGVRKEEMAPVSFELAGNEDEWFRINRAASKRSLKFPKAEARWADWTNDHPEFKGLQLQNLRYQDIRVIIGNDAQELRQLENPQVLRDSSGKYIAIRSKLGWTICGPRFDVSQGTEEAATILMLFSAQLNEEARERAEILEAFAKFNSLEALGVSKAKSHFAPMELRCLEKLKQDIIFEADGRPKLPMLWKDEVKPPPSEQQARSRLQSLQRKLSKNPRLAQLYNDSFEKDLQKGYIRQLTMEEAEELRKGPHYFLPHFPVFHPDKPDKCRRVWDAKAVNQGLSLNHLLDRGPDLLASLLGILLRFRIGTVAVNGDITEFYQQVLLFEKDCAMVAFLWSKDPSVEPSVFINLRHVFGAKCSPATACFAAQEALRRGGLDPNDVDLYMDDWFYTAETEEEAIQFAQKVARIFADHKFHLSKWMSNRPGVLAAFPRADWAAAVKELSPEDGDALPRIKILGVRWDSHKDELKLSSRLPNPPSAPKTVAEVLSTLATMFDPLGIVAPISLSGKLLFQQCWNAVQDWRKALPTELAELWLKFLQSLPLLESVGIPRAYGLRRTAPTTVHVFSDASTKGYGAVVYAMQSQGTPAFVMAKGRVINQSKTASVPRLELQAFVVAVRLAVTVHKEWKDNIKIAKLVFWSDSITVLRWIRNENTRYQPFVANRLGEVASTFSEEFKGLEVVTKHVPTKLNPADLLSRGCTATEFVANFKFWASGPDFISKEEDAWPAFDLSSAPEDNSELRKNLELVCAAFPFAKEAQESDTLLDFLDRLSEANDGLSRPELEREAIQVAQASMELPGLKRAPGKVTIPSSGVAKGLALFKDQGGLVRVVSRAEQADFLSSAEKYPLLLPAGHPLTKLFIREAHQAAGHQGLEATKAEFSRRFYASRIRAMIRHELHFCKVCRAYQPRRMRAPLAPLHPSRLKQGAAPFSECGMDHFGPTKVGAGRGKMWALLFVCLTSRAIHVEDCASAKTSDALLALQRFVDRRGRPDVIRCDKAAAFRAAARVMKKTSAQLAKEFQVEASRMYPIQFVFNPPYAPHWGGSWERQIAEVKKIVRLLQESSESVSKITAAAYRTFLVHAEAIINDRPIAHDNNGVPIRPSQLLNPASQDNGGFPVSASPAKVLRRVRQAVNYFWRRWKTYYLSSISLSRHSGGRLRPLQLQPGDPVLVTDPTKIFGDYWQSATVIKPHVSSDGYIRSVELQVGNKVQRHDIRNVGAVDPTVLRRMMSPLSPQIQETGGVSTTGQTVDPQHD